MSAMPVDECEPDTSSDDPAPGDTLDELREKYDRKRKRLGPILDDLQERMQLATRLLEHRRAARVIPKGLVPYSPVAATKPTQVSEK